MELESKRMVRRFEPSTPPFRFRAILLAGAALAMAGASLVLALTTPDPAPPRLLPKPTEQEWPEDFVEWQLHPELGEAASSGATTAPSASATDPAATTMPSTPSAMPGSSALRPAK